LLKGVAESPWKERDQSTWSPFEASDVGVAIESFNPSDRFWGGVEREASFVGGFVGEGPEEVEEEDTELAGEDAVDAYLAPTGFPVAVRVLRILVFDAFWRL
jgi:hypothetical protein